MIDLVSLQEKAERAKRYLSLKVPAMALGSHTPKGCDVAIVHGVRATDYEALLEDFNSVCSELSAARESKWISVKQELPACGGKYLAIVYGWNELKILWWSKEHKFWSFMSNETPIAVTHWMPLPAPPTELLEPEKAAK